MRHSSAPLVALTMLLTSLSARPLTAQLAELQPGTRVRVRGSEVAGRLQGVVLSRSGDSLTVSRPTGPPIPLALSALSRVEVSRGKSRSRGAWRGLLWGAGIGAVLGLVPTDDPECDRDPDAFGCGSRAESMVLTAIGGSVIGVPIGAIVGVERWETLELPLRVGLSRAHGRNGLLLGIAW